MIKLYVTFVTPLRLTAKLYHLTLCLSRYSEQGGFYGLDEYLNYELRSGGQVLTKDVNEVLIVFYSFLDTFS